MFKNVHVDTIMTHTNETNNEIIMSYGSAYYLVHKLGSRGEWLGRTGIVVLLGSDIDGSLGGL